MFKRVLKLVAVVAILNYGATAPAEVAIETVIVGNPGNAWELSGDCVPNGTGPCRECGAVDYVYNIGKYEVTAGEYSVFLNAVAAEDTYGLYNEEMWTSEYGCKIERTGESPDYSYSVDSGWADRPVNYVSWGDAARFCNWLHNGQPTGVQAPTTTEDGAYELLGSIDGSLMSVERKQYASWVIPTEDEWYKAAYHKNDGETGNYWDYPTRTDLPPNNGNPEGDTGNSANFHDGDYSIGAPFWRTAGGFFAGSVGPYGTFDQGGNIWEWNEASYAEAYRRIRGGSYFWGDYGAKLHAAYAISLKFPDADGPALGFRVAARVPSDSVEGIDPGGPKVILNPNAPGSGDGDPVDDPLVEFDYQSGPPDLGIAASIPCFIRIVVCLLPTGGFGDCCGLVFSVSPASGGDSHNFPGFASDEYSAVGASRTYAEDVEFLTTITIPFDGADLGGVDALSLNLMAYDAIEERWVVAVQANSQDSPGHTDPVGDRFEVVGTNAPTLDDLSDDLGDYGVFWNPDTQTGFVWARVDYASEFVVGANTPVPAVSMWGLVAMTLLVLTAGTLVYARRRPARA